ANGSRNPASSVGAVSTFAEPSAAANPSRAAGSALSEGAGGGGVLPRRPCPRAPAVAWCSRADHLTNPLPQWGRTPRLRCPAPVRRELLAGRALEELGRVDQRVAAGRQDGDAQQRVELLDRDALQHLGRQGGVEPAVGLGLTLCDGDVGIGLALGLRHATLRLELRLLHLRLGLEGSLRGLLLPLDL